MNNDLLKGISASAFIKSVLKFSVSSWLNFFISIFSITICTRIFSPNVYGLLSVFNSSSTLLVGIACLGLDSAFLRFYNEPPIGYNSKQLLLTCMGLSLIFLALLTFFLVPFFYEEIAIALFDSACFLFIVLLCANAFSFIILNFFLINFRMNADVKNYTIQSVLLQFCSKCFVISAAFVEPTVVTVLTFNTVGVFFLTMIYFLAQRKHIWVKKISFSIVGFEEVLKFAFFSWPIVIIVHLNTFLSQMVISWNLGTYALGIYASAGVFVGILGVIQNGFNTYWAAFMYANYDKEQEKIKRVHNYVLLFTVVVMSVFIALQNFLYSVLGESYHESRMFFTMTLIYPLFLLISQTTAYGITIVKKTYYSLFIFIVSMLTNVVGCYIFTKNFGLVGAAVSSMLSAVIYLLLATVLGQKYYKTVSNPQKTVIAAAVVLLMAITNCIFIENYWLEMSIITILFFIVVAFFRYDISMLILFIRSNYRKARVSN